MSTAKDRAAAMAAKFSAPGEERAEQRPEPKTRPTARTKRVRHTVDLPPARHHKMTEWCSDTAVQLGVARITNQQVHEALVRLLLTDETTARKVRKTLEDDLEQA